MTRDSSRIFTKSWVVAMWLSCAAVAVALLLRCAPWSAGVTPRVVPVAEEVEEEHQTSIVAEEAAHLERVPAAELPSDEILVRIRGEAPEALSFVWSTGQERYVLPPPGIPAEPDGWWRVPAAPGGEQWTHLAVCTSDQCVGWIVSPGPGSRHELSNATSTQLIEVRDVETGSGFPGAVLRLSQQDFGTEAWEPNSFPGPNEASAIYHTRELRPGLYRLNGALLNGELPGRGHSYELRHEHYVKARSAPLTLMLRAGVSTVPAQMPVVASVRYIGDELLDGTISHPGTLLQDPVTLSFLREWRERLAKEHENTLTVLFLDDGKPDKNLRVATTSCILRHGPRRTDRIPVVRLADYTGPTEIVVSPVGEEVRLQKVTIGKLPKFGDVEAKFKVIVNGGSKWPFQVVDLGDSIELPPGNYSLLGRGDWAFGALERKKFTVRAGEPTTFDLEWRADIRMYVLQCEGQGVRMVQVEVGEGRKKFVVDAPVDEKGQAVFWVKSVIEDCIVHTRGCRPSPVTFAQTSDPRVSRAHCRFVPEDGR